MPHGIKNPNPKPVMNFAARLDEAHAALQLRPSTLEPFRHLAMQHLLTTTDLLNPLENSTSDSSTLDRATASFISAYGGKIWPSYSVYRSHLTVPPGTPKAKTLEYPRDAMLKNAELVKAKNQGVEEELMVAKTVLGKVVGKLLKLVVEEAKKTDRVVDLGEEIRENLVKVICEQEEWEELEKEIAEVVEQSGKEIVQGDVDMKEVGVEDEVVMKDGDEGLEIESAPTHGERIPTAEEWLEWAMEVKQERKRADSVTKVSEWIEGVENGAPE